jgi:hypothetical protein
MRKFESYVRGIPCLHLVFWHLVSRMPAPGVLAPGISQKERARNRFGGIPGRMLSRPREKSKSVSEGYVESFARTTFIQRGWTRQRWMCPRSVFGASGTYSYQATARALARITIPAISAHVVRLVFCSGLRALFCTRRLLLTVHRFGVVASVKGQARRAEGLMANLASLAVSGTQRGATVVAKSLCGSAACCAQDVFQSARLHHAAIKMPVLHGGHYTGERVVPSRRSRPRKLVRNRSCDSRGLGGPGDQLILLVFQRAS